MRYKAVCLFALLAGVIPPAHAEASPRSAATARADTSPAYVITPVRQPDGGVIDRLTWVDSTGQRRNTDSVASRGSEAWLAMMLDSTRHGVAFKNPKAFSEWLGAVTEPRFMTALATVAMEPDAYSQALDKLIDPETARNWAEFVDPALLMRWMSASVDPEFYLAIFNRMSDLEKYRRWAILPTTSEAIGVAATALRPATYSNWFNAGSSPKNQALASRVLDPGTYAIWLTAFADGVRRTGEGAVSEQTWITLPTSEAKSNPWLVNGKSYRY